MIAVVDYHKGNIASVVRGLQAAGADVVVTDSPEQIGRASAIVLPGVGAFSDAMSTLDDLQLTPALISAINKGVPYLGICLGMHLLFEGGTEHASPEHPSAGLAVLPGIVDRFPAATHEFKVPHIGWNTVEFEDAGNPLFKNVTSGEHFYFVHSYIAPDSKHTIATTEHSLKFPSVVQKDNVYGIQFHPEKSSDVGATILANWLSIITT